jgi:hypothetical protein
MANSRRLQIPNLSNARHRWLLITGSAGPNDLPDFAIRKPLPNEKRDLNFFADARAQKQGAQVLFYGAGTKVELARNFLIAAALREQVQNLLVVTFS